MFSMAVTGLVKSLIVVTVSLHPAAAPPAPAHYTVRPGDTLSADRPPRVRQRGRLARPVVDQPARGARPRRHRGGPAAGAEHLAPAPGMAGPGRPGRHPGPRPAAERAHGGGGRNRGASASAARGDLACTDFAPGDLACGDLPRGAGQLPGVRDRPRVRRKRPRRQPGLGCGRPVPVPARHLAEPGILRAAARRAHQRAERGIPAGIRPVGYQPMGTLRRVLTAAAGTSRPEPGRPQLSATPAHRRRAGRPRAGEHLRP